MGLFKVTVATACVIYCVFLVGGAPWLLPYHNSTKIVGGEPINISDAPYQVAVQLGGSMVCGGVILAPTFILTAAHCIIRTTNYYSVRMGTTDHVIGGTVLNAINITIHPKYDDVLYDYDAAIIELDSPIHFDENSQPIDLLSNSDVSGNVIITGWGTTGENESTSRTLNAVTVPTFDSQTCNELYEEFGGLTERMFCAGSPAHDSCYGDSGGPVVTDDRLLAGIVSWGNGCARDGFPGVNTKINNPEITDFIQKMISVP